MLQFFIETHRSEFELTNFLSFFVIFLSFQFLQFLWQFVIALLIRKNFKISKRPNFYFFYLFYLFASHLFLIQWISQPIYCLLFQLTLHSLHTPIKDAISLNLVRQFPKVSEIARLKSPLDCILLLIIIFEKCRRNRKIFIKFPPLVVKLYF